MKLSILGTGYVGLVTGICFTEKGHHVTLVDVDKNRIESVLKGNLPIYEPGLQEIFTEAKKKDLVSATTNVEGSVANSDISFICVGTPMNPDKSIELKHVYSVAESIASAIKLKSSYHLIVVKSTVVPGTTKKVSGIIDKYSEKRLGRGFGIAMNPEFLREGCAVEDFRFPDRVVLGTENNKDLTILNNLYNDYDCPLVPTNTVTAEMIKYASNAILSTLVSFSNEISNICEKIGGVDQKEVFDAIKLDKRWNPLVNGQRTNPQILSYLMGGPGFGGSCFPKDVNALRAYARSIGIEPRLLDNVMQINENQPIHTVKELQEKTSNKKIAVLGLSFKPDTDDIRESPAIYIVEELLKREASVSVTDPLSLYNFQKRFGDKITYHTTAEECLKGTDAAIIVTQWNEYKNIKPRDFIRIMKNPVVFDTRRIYDAQEMKNAGVHYLGTGYSK
jgi:UDPglucose 6-dehydrogenase